MRPGSCGYAVGRKSGEGAGVVAEQCSSGEEEDASAPSNNGTCDVLTFQGREKG